MSDNCKPASVAEERLYDLRKEQRPNHGFRSVQTFKCWVCGALTNRNAIATGIYPAPVRRTVCPNAAEDWHHELYAIYKEQNTKGCPDDVQRALARKTEEILQRSKSLIKDDVVGAADTSNPSPVDNALAWKGSDPRAFSIREKESYEWQTNDEK